MSDNGECSMGPLGVYILVTSALNSVAVVVLIVVIVVALWKIYRRQSSIIAWILDVDKEASNGRFNFGHRGSPRVSRDTYIPISSSSPETVREVLSPQSPSSPEARQDRSSGGQQGDTNVDDAVKSEGAVGGGLGQKVKQTLTRKNKRSLSLPRGKTKRTQATTNLQFDMKRVTYELKKTDQFQRTSAECDGAAGTDEEGTPPNRTFGTLERHNANRSHRDRAGDGNEYAMAVISKKPDLGCAPALNKTKGDPFYFQLNGAAQDDDDADTRADTRAIRDRRSMSDASFVQSAVSRFPLKMIFDKSGKPSKQRQTKKAKSEDQPLPLVESTLDNEYERINRESSLVKRPRHAAVTTAESAGEYSKLQRNVTKDNGAAPAQGYDRISAGASSSSPAKKENSKSRFSMIN